MSDEVLTAEALERARDALRDTPPKKPSDYTYVANGEEEAELARQWFPGVKVVLAQPVPPRRR